MTFDDEKALLANKDPNIDPINILLNRCLSNLTVNELYQMDKLYILMKLREISYGDEYNLEISCPSCQKDSSVMFKLSELPIKEVSEDFSDSVEITLPVLEPEPEPIQEVISEVIEKLPLRDAHAVLNAISSTKYGLDTQVSFLCNYCNTRTKMELPITSDFFTVS